ncbi:MAG: cytochrome B [Flavobacteriales bacterium]|nr:cytochrome B [Flavobacteriales bacterium]
MDSGFLPFFHSLLRYAVLLTLLYAFAVNLRGVLQQRPILTGERAVTILAMVLCHVQLGVGGILYAMDYQMIDKMADPYRRFWKFEHIGMMVLAIALITVGRMLSKRATDERTKQMRIVVFYGIGLLLILVAVPWPFRDEFRSLGWL